MPFRLLPDSVPGLHQYSTPKWMADIFLSYLKKFGIEENFCLSKDGLGPSSDCMKATLLSNHVISHYSSSLEYHLTRKDSSIFKRKHLKILLARNRLIEKNASLRPSEASSCLGAYKFFFIRQTGKDLYTEVTPS